MWLWLLYYIILYYIILYYITYMLHTYTHTIQQHNVSLAVPAIWQRGARREGERMKVYIWENLNICNANIFMFDIMKIFYVLLISLYLSFIRIAIIVLPYCCFVSYSCFCWFPSLFPRLFPLDSVESSLSIRRIPLVPTILRSQKGEKCAFANRLGISRKPRD